MNTNHRRVCINRLALWVANKMSERKNVRAELWGDDVKFIIHCRYLTEIFVNIRKENHTHLEKDICNIWQYQGNENMGFQ